MLERKFLFFAWVCTLLEEEKKDRLLVLFSFSFFFPNFKLKPGLFSGSSNDFLSFLLSALFDNMETIGSRQSTR